MTKVRISAHLSKDENVKYDKKLRYFYDISRLVYDEGNTQYTKEDVEKIK